MSIVKLTEQDSGSDKFPVKWCNSHLWGLTRTEDISFQTLTKFGG